MLVRSIALVIVGGIIASRPPPALADVPALDFPSACLPSLYGQAFSNPQPVWFGTARVPGGSGMAVEESVSFWRASCGGGEAALMMRLGWQLPYFDPQVSMPRLTVRQNGREADLVALQVATGFFTQTAVQPVAAGAPKASPGVFALTTGGTNAVDLRAALTMQVRNPFTGEATMTLDIGPYASHSPPLEINGRLVGNFYDPAKSGEGIIVEIGDLGPPQAGERQRRYLQYNWFTYDNYGRPFWISGGTEFLEGDTHVHMPAIYRGGGRFAGGKAATDITSWGTVDLEFADCNTLRIGYSANAALPPAVPGGSGQLEWKRLTGVSGYRCE
jgi:hypothetical protein